MHQYLTDEDGPRLVSRAEARTLREIADKSGAGFVRAEDDRQVNDALDEILVQGRPVAGYHSYPVRKDLYRYFLAAAFACLVGGIFV